MIDKTARIMIEETSAIRVPRAMAEALYKYKKYKVHGYTNLIFLRKTMLAV